MLFSSIHASPLLGFEEKNNISPQTGDSASYLCPTAQHFGSSDFAGADGSDY